ncbi:MAG: YicC family protein [Oscillospiraceae bacterium]|nr:YicC family protein [Oscillospiraceae bacterium]
MEENKIMIRSMTGFGRSQNIIDGREITVEIRAVNHKFLEFSARVPRKYGYIEEKLKSVVGGFVKRGKAEVNITINQISGKEVTVTVNRDVVESYVSALRELEQEFHLEDNLCLSDVFRMTDAFTIVKSEVDEDAVWEAVKSVVEVALDKLVSMRKVEGDKLKHDIQSRLDFIEDAVSEIEILSPDSVVKHREKLLERMNEVVSKGVDEQRILLEAAIFAEKTAVDEETVRLRSHVEQFRELLDTEDVVGRKLDFLVQEMNREINTIGSKAQELSVTRIVVDLKSELEKIREQIQNIE